MMRIFAGSCFLLLAGWLASPAGAQTLLVASKSDHTLAFVDLPTGRAVAKVPTGKHPHEVGVSGDGRLAVVTNYGGRAPGNTLTVVDVAAARVLRTVDLGEHRRPHGVAWIEGPRFAVTAEGSRHLLVVDVEAGKILQAIPTGQDVSHMVVVTPDAARAFVSNIGSGSVTVVDLAEGRKIRDIPTGAGAEGIALSPDGREVWVGNRADDTLSVIDVASLEVSATVPCKGFPIRVVFTPDGKRLLVSCARAGEVAVVDPRSRKEILRRALDLRAVEDDSGRLFQGAFGKSPVPVGLLVAPDGGRAYVAATQADAVAELALPDLEAKRILDGGREPDGMAYAPVRVRKP